MGNKPSTLDESIFKHSADQKIEDLYSIENKKLGRGHYATVWLGKDKRSQQPVAIKRIKRALTDERRLRSEIGVLQKAGKHPNIVELIDVFETTRDVYLVMELCTGGELFDRLADKGPYSEADCGRHIKDMAEAVLYLHKKGIVHRDLKPENILLSTEDDRTAVVKVADFGLAKIVTGNLLKTKCGTWGYSAAEMISGSGFSFGYNEKVDSWSIGTILYILLCGYHPFDPLGTSTDNEMMDSIRNCRFDFEDEAWSGTSDGARDLIQKLLVLDPQERYSMEQVLNHPWILGVAGRTTPVCPLSPTIHKDLAKYRANARKKTHSFSEIDVELEDE